MNTNDTTQEKMDIEIVNSNQDIQQIEQIENIYISKPHKPAFKKQNIHVINNLSDIHNHIDKLLKTDEACIMNYLERHIYISTIPENIKHDINIIYENIYKTIINIS